MFSKKKRFKSKENLALVRSQRCLVCKSNPPNEPDHLRTRGAGGGDELFNLLALCRRCHTLRHLLGLKNFAVKFNLAISWDMGYPRRIDTQGETNGQILDSERDKKAGISSEIS